MEIAAINADVAQTLLGKSTPLSADEVAKLLRFLKHTNDELANKLRQLKSEIGRVARH